MSLSVSLSVRHFFFIIPARGAPSFRVLHGLSDRLWLPLEGPSVCPLCPEKAHLAHRNRHPWMPTGQSAQPLKATGGSQVDGIFQGAEIQCERKMGGDRGRPALAHSGLAAFFILRLLLLLLLLFFWIFVSVVLCLPAGNLAVIFILIYNLKKKSSSQLTWIIQARGACSSLETLLVPEPTHQPGTHSAATP